MDTRRCLSTISFVADKLYERPDQLTSHELDQVIIMSEQLKDMYLRLGGKGFNPGSAEHPRKNW
jgi:hypothetical protein